MINIAEILKKCSKGTKLYSPICGECELHFVGDNLIYVKCDDMCYGFNPDGTYRAKTGECLLFPSKENRDWNKFIPFKEWDILYTVTGEGRYYLCIVDCIIGGILYTKASCSCSGHFLCTCEEQTDMHKLVVVRFATEKEKKILFDAIKAHGYKWNHETRTLEKLLEPRFKIGDWIISDEVHQDYHICQITDIDDNKYYIESIEGYKGFNYFDAFEKLYRQWTIQDAKDGDVLTTDMVHFIFKSKDGMDCYMHCYYSVLINKYVTSYTAIVDSICVHPATKEQRNLLFRKMKESGYEWDAEKKELNEIEPKSALSEEDINTLNRVSAILVNASEVKNWWKEYRLIEKDEMIRLTDFLKSLKDRCTWKPSDEQMEALHYVTNFDYGGHKATLVSLYEQLKKLKD